MAGWCEFGEGLWVEKLVVAADLRVLVLTLPQRGGFPVVAHHRHRTRTELDRRAGIGGGRRTGWSGGWDCCMSGGRGRAGCADASSPSSSTATTLRFCRVPVPVGGDHGGSAVNAVKLEI